MCSSSSQGLPAECCAAIGSLQHNLSFLMIVQSSAARDRHLLGGEHLCQPPLSPGCFHHSIGQCHRDMTVIPQWPLLLFSIQYIHRSHSAFRHDSAQSSNHKFIIFISSSEMVKKKKPFYSHFGKPIATVRHGSSLCVSSVGHRVRWKAETA